MEENPFAVDSLQQFSYYCCPKCPNVKLQTKQKFVQHAFENHPNDAIALYNIHDKDVDWTSWVRNPKGIPSVTILKKEEEEIKDEELVVHPDDLQLPLTLPNNIDFDHVDEDFDIHPGIEDEEDIMDEDDIKGDFKCLVCSQLFDTAGKLSNHACTITLNTNNTQKTDSDDQQQHCDDDFQIVDDKTKAHHLKLRKKDHHKNNINKKKVQLKCSECDLKCSTEHKLRIHLLKEHNIGKDRERCLCSLCGKTLVGRSNFKKHEREKHGIDNIFRKRIVKPLKINCSKCSMAFESVSDLNVHVIACQEVSHNFSCPSCPLTWCSGPVLNLHLKSDHKMQEIYTCNVCGKCFKRKISVDSHNKVEHEGIKDHVCHLCGTGFARAQGLKFHIQRVHEHSGRYACEYCDFKTVAQMKLDIHVNEVHTKAVKFHCQECNFFCYRKGGLLAHVRTVHLKLKPHECPSCPEAFGRRKELEKHQNMAGH